MALTPLPPPPPKPGELFGEALPVPLEAQIAAVEREIGLRARVYPRLIESGRMTPERAAGEQRAMRAVLDTLRAVARGSL